MEEIFGRRCVARMFIPDPDPKFFSSWILKKNRDAQLNQSVSYNSSPVSSFNKRRRILKIT
jgi:hypothetical protein